MGFVFKGGIESANTDLCVCVHCRRWHEKARCLQDFELVESRQGLRVDT